MNVNFRQGHRGARFTYCAVANAVSVVTGKTSGS
jgi:hypothetical protein